MTDKDKTYNGWTNYETWVVNMWMEADNQATHLYWEERTREIIADTKTNFEPAYASQTMRDAATYDLSKVIEEHHERYAERAMSSQSGFLADLLNAALSEVNWYEIAEHRIEDNWEDEEVDQ